MREFWFLLLAMMWFVSGCQSDVEYEDEIYVEGYRGKAKRNPYLAAEMFIREGGKDAFSMKGVVGLDEQESLVFAPASSVRSTGDGERILEWIADGGHYVCFLQRGEDFWNDIGVAANHNPEEWDDRFADLSGVEIMLERVGLELEDLEPSVDRPHFILEEEEGDDHQHGTFSILDNEVTRGEVLPRADLVKVGFLGDTYELLLGGTKGVKNRFGPGSAQLDKDNDGVRRFESRDYGAGKLTIISDGRLFRNPYLGMVDHAELLDAMVASSGDGMVVFSLGKVRSFLSMLGEYGWMACVALLVLTALWLWKNLPKYGPTLDVVDGHYRDSSKQMLATGNFFWTHRRVDALLQPLRDEVVRRSGALGEDGYLDEGMLERLAAGSGLSFEDVKEAMTKPEVREASAMVRITQHLQRLLKSL